MSAFTKTDNLNSSVNFKAVKIVAFVRVELGPPGLRPRRTKSSYSTQRAAGRVELGQMNLPVLYAVGGRSAVILRGKKRDRVILKITEHLFVLAGTFNWVFEWR